MLTVGIRSVYANIILSPQNWRGRISPASENRPGHREAFNRVQWSLRFGDEAQTQSWRVRHENKGRLDSPEGFTKVPFAVYPTIFTPTSLSPERLSTTSVGVLWGQQDKPFKYFVSRTQATLLVLFQIFLLPSLSRSVLISYAWAI